MRRLALALLAACTPYQPELGTAPYLCGDVEPRCPQSYECVEDEDQVEVCVRGELPPDRPIHCADDTALEPNDTIATAASVPAGSSFTISELSICPAGERDTFEVALSDGQSIEVIATFARDAQPLDGSILNLAGVPIARATPRGEPPTSLRAVATGLTGGRYFVQIFGINDSKGSYDLAVKISGP